tara:strand:- start:735 stop:1319 length:585 start_codon:yes stop_codon:yes gene_type:complete
MAINKRFGRWSYETLTVAQHMERFAVKRGLIKSMGGNAGLAKLATNYFENINVDAEGVFTGSYGLLTSVQGSYDESGKLAVDVVQLKGGDLAEFLDSEEGPTKAMESRKRWSGFLDEATGYNAKQRGDKAKEEAKKFSKAKSAIKMAHKSMELMKNLDQDTIDQANELIAKLEAMIEAGTPPSETQVKKLDKLF